MCCGVSDIFGHNFHKICLSRKDDRSFERGVDCELLMGGDDSVLCSRQHTSPFLIIPVIITEVFWTKISSHRRVMHITTILGDQGFVPEEPIDDFKMIVEESNAQGGISGPGDVSDILVGITILKELADLQMTIHCGHIQGKPAVPIGLPIIGTTSK